MTAVVWSYIPNAFSQSLWYETPAKAWEEALPLGNGHTGAMVFGGINQEHIQLNDVTLWSGHPMDGNNTEAAKVLPELRNAIFKRDFTGAEQLWKKMQGPFSANYLPMGDLLLNFKFDEATVRNYKRTLDLKRSETVTTFKVNGVTYTRKAFISYPDKVMIFSISADKAHQISFSAGLESVLRNVSKGKKNSLILSGLAPQATTEKLGYPDALQYDEQNGMKFEIRATVQHIGGTLRTEGNKLIVEKADEVTIYITEATSFNGFDKMPSGDKNPDLTAKSKAIAAVKKGKDKILADHLKDYQHLFNRVTFQLKSPDYSNLPTDTRLKRFAHDTTDLDFQTLYFQFGRYLMISSSRPGGHATNLQALWNDQAKPAWRSNFTININTEMNYWPAENLNLSECHEPLFDFIRELSVNGAKTAQTNYGISPGWVAHHNSDIWAMTNPVGAQGQLPGAFCWQMGGAWLSTHLWEHYAYTFDKKFLRETGYPLMKGAAQFLLKWLIQDPESKYLVTAPSTSPENGFFIDGKKHFITRASTMDMSITRELFTDVLKASKVLKVDPDFSTQLSDALNKLYPFQIGRYGQIQEWYDDVDNPKDTHRHVSQLFGLFPGNQIHLDDTKALAAAAETTLVHRTDYSTGWSMAWKINWWSRLRNGDHAYLLLCKAFRFMDPFVKTKDGVEAGGTYPNLFDACPPFQIDANFGVVAGIAEMLMQSHRGYIDLLPALPKSWQEGSINGLKARGNFEVSMTWKAGKLVSVSIKSVSGGNCNIRTPDKMKVLKQAKSHIDAQGLLSFPTIAGKTYTLVRI
ncbi:MAG: alpha-L-fucosidase [Chitinophagaceae bacterium]|nr:alpha-L-fucosidase [Chitinophagaceae bacterium]